ncbi:MAG: tRNA uridine-5-carboxymethylaminomethyl(34) synthesis GTPase MnmE [Candidatus Omnitrophota bacterium]
MKIMAEHIYAKDTIAAVATAWGEGGIGIIRLSGPKAISIVDKIFIAKNKKKLNIAPSFTLHYGFIQDKQKSAVKKNKYNKKTEIIDEVIVSLMRSPYTYTREDVLEINSHGGIVAVKKILNLVLKQGARLANPGEFTQRAFLNGRIDLIQAEAVLNIVNAKTEAALAPAMAQLQGVLSAKINILKNSLIEIIAPLEAEIDFPDESVDRVFRRRLAKKLKLTLSQIKIILNDADKGIMLQNGISMVLAGAANVGKSSLMNAFVDYERVIVTHISGTTRDVVEELINIKGVPVKIADTAGIMNSSCVITKESVSRSLIFF